MYYSRKILHLTLNVAKDKLSQSISILIYKLYKEVLELHHKVLEVDNIVYRGNKVLYHEV